MDNVKLLQDSVDQRIDYHYIELFLYITHSLTLRILCKDLHNMRKSFDGLCGLVISELAPPYKW